MVEVLFFSGKNCGVCHVLKPKLFEVIENEFGNNVKLLEVCAEEDIEMAAQNLVFTLPVVVIRRDNKEVKRFVRSFGVTEVAGFLHRTT